MNLSYTSWITAKSSLVSYFLKRAADELNGYTDIYLEMNLRLAMKSTN